MPGEQRTRTIRYETIIATLVGVSALFVSGYTAYVQRQQVRAAVWPILEFDTSNDPMIYFNLENKGVGPAIIRHVIVTVDGQPVRTWNDALDKLVGPGKHKFSRSTMNGHAIAAGESDKVLVPLEADGSPLTQAKGGPLWNKLNADRFRVHVEICYSSTLGECWTLHGDLKTNSTTETRNCPKPSATSFQE